jgi:transcriptional regulator with XRE-family HTH domain
VIKLSNFKLKSQKSMQHSILEAKNNYEKRFGSQFTPNKETCDRIGITPKRLSRILSGKTTKQVSAIELKGISTLFGVPMEQLMT